MNRLKFVYFLLSGLLLFSMMACVEGTPSTNDKLPILGNRDVTSEGDTIFHTIPDFSFVDQDSNVITNATFEDKIYIADFFFIHCPAICPRVKAQMMRIYEKFEDNDRLVFLSHTMDPKRDTIPALKAYANKLDIKTDKWHFVTGDKDLIFSIGDDYFVTVLEDSDAPGGFDHSGRIILVDGNRQVRAFAEGTEPESVDDFFLDIEKLLKEVSTN